mmetsp:Transcript_44924/g.128908  ORF Transcript_44924/g.128908 Transcript_44924/m.128908 type:complete len:251 (+) Transcript_44924:33-785(+)
MASSRERSWLFAVVLEHASAPKASDELDVGLLSRIRLAPHGLGHECEPRRLVGVALGRLLEEVVHQLLVHHPLPGLTARQIVTALCKNNHPVHERSQELRSLARGLDAPMLDELSGQRPHDLLVVLPGSLETGDLPSTRNAVLVPVTDSVRQPGSPILWTELGKWIDLGAITSTIRLRVLRLSRRLHHGASTTCNSPRNQGSSQATSNKHWHDWYTSFARRGTRLSKSCEVCGATGAKDLVGMSRRAHKC